MNFISNFISLKSRKILNFKLRSIKKWKLKNIKNSNEKQERTKKLTFTNYSTKREEKLLLKLYFLELFSSIYFFSFGLSIISCVSCLYDSEPTSHYSSSGNYQQENKERKRKGKTTRKQENKAFNDDKKSK